MHIRLPYAPRPAFQAYHRRQQRWAVNVVHRRGGKTVAGINDLVRGALTCKRAQPRFAYIAPYRQQAKMVAWDYLKLYTAPIPGVKVHESELRVDLPNGGRVTLYGADNPDALRGIYLDGVVVDEPADMKPEVWTDILRPALSDRSGWCTWIGTPKGRNAFFRLYDRAVNDPAFFTMILPASTSGILPQEELDSARKDMGKESYEREYECSFNAAVPGAIYGDVISMLRAQRRILDFPVDQGFPIFTFWDLGRSDYTCIWLIQMVGKDINILDYYSGTGKGPGHYSNHCMGWERTYDKPIAAHYLPHDAEQEDRNGGTWKTDLLDAGLRNIKVVVVTPDKWRGINRLREQLLPKCYIHKTNCERTFGTAFDVTPSGLDCLEQYSKREQNEMGIISEEPLHNEYSHGADALRTFSEAYSLGMIDGTSFVAKDSRRLPDDKGNFQRPKVLRGPSEQSYPIRHANLTRPRVLR